MHNRIAYHLILFLLLVTLPECRDLSRPANPVDTDQVIMVLSQSESINNLSEKVFSYEDWFAYSDSGHALILQNAYSTFIYQNAAMSFLSLNSTTEDSAKFLYEEYIDRKINVLKRNHFSTNMASYSLSKFTIKDESFVLWRNGNWLFIITSKDRQKADAFRNEFIAAVTALKTP